MPCVGCRLFRDLGNHKLALAAYLRIGDQNGVARSCEAEAEKLAATEPVQAERRLSEAMTYYRRAKNYQESFRMIQRHPKLAQNMSAEVSPAAAVPPNCNLVLVNMLPELRL